MNPIKAIWFWLAERFHLIKLNGDYKRYLVSGLTIPELNKVCKLYGLETNNHSQDYETKKNIVTPKSYKQLQRTLITKLSRENLYNAIIKSKVKTDVKTYEGFVNVRK